VPAIALDTKLNVRFIRTGTASEGSRVALANVATLFDVGSRHWHITLTWDPTEIAIEVRDQGSDLAARSYSGSPERR
jgi:hypothetical protein